MEHHNTHPFDAYVDSDSKILILGSFPSVKSRAQNFYYGHPQNRFWKVIARCVNDEVPQTLEEKKQFLSRHQIALWDVIDSCDIAGSSDASIRNAKPTDIKYLLNQATIEKILVNGKTASKLFRRYWPDLEFVELPSTSAANASMSLERLIEEYKCAFLD